MTERDAFEAWYAAMWKRDSIVAASHPIEFLCSELKEMRQSDNYGNNPYLNNLWKGWKARAEHERNAK